MDGASAAELSYLSTGVKKGYVALRTRQLECFRPGHDMPTTELAPNIAFNHAARVSVPWRQAAGRDVARTFSLIAQRLESCARLSAEFDENGVSSLLLNFAELRYCHPALQTVVARAEELHKKLDDFHVASVVYACLQLGLDGRGLLDRLLPNSTAIDRFSPSTLVCICWAGCCGGWYCPGLETALRLCKVRALSEEVLRL